MLTERTSTQFGIAAVVLMGILLVVVGFRLVPASWDIPLFVAAMVLFSLRLILRTIIARRNRQQSAPTGPADPP
jgi:hypothetical protein